MSYNKYFEDELSYLRELGAEFASENPQLARFLGSQSYDPDVERLLEGFAFLTSRLRQKLDDERPELTHSLIALLWPHFLRPIPSMSILAFKLNTPSNVTGIQRIRRGVSIDSKAVEGTVCRFQTCFDVDVMPISLAKVDYQTTAAGYEINMQFDLDAGVSFEKLGLNKIRLYLHGEPRIAQLLYLWFMRYLDNVVVSVADSAQQHQQHQQHSLPASAVNAVGFANDEGLLPYPENTFVGYRLLQEYFSFPEKFLFIDVTSLAFVQTFPMATQFELQFNFNRPLDDAIRPTVDNFRLYCTPIVNLFENDATPIRLDQRKPEYRVRAAAENPNHYEVYSIDHVQGWVHGIGAGREYKAFESFDFEEPDGETGKTESAVFYRARFYPVEAGRSVDTYLSFVNINDEAVIPPTESIAIELTCTNGAIASKLQSGDIRTGTSSTPDFVTVENITRVTNALPPPMGPDLHWRLMSNMALNYTSLTNIDALRTVLSTYNFAAFYDQPIQRASQRRLEGITHIVAEPSHHLFQGLPVRGMRIRMALKESKFSGEGDLYLFASIINEFFALYANMNSFHQLIVRGSEQGEVYQWPARVGQQIVL
ncbi:MAG: type VI secretion system baseplate subunit TssF [Gammaproteobacteria bacterium]|nr:type VI secretion system baseplate subunit TssF [Gammaproteobacteria bacterium]